MILIDRLFQFEIDNIEDDGEIDKDSPVSGSRSDCFGYGSSAHPICLTTPPLFQFDFAASAQSRDQCIYVPLLDPAFLMDRNRQLHYCVNRGFML